VFFFFFCVNLVSIFRKRELQSALGGKRARKQALDAGHRKAGTQSTAHRLSHSGCITVLEESGLRVLEGGMSQAADLTPAVTTPAGRAEAPDVPQPGAHFLLVVLDPVG